LQKARKSGAQTVIHQGLNYFKSKVYGQLGVPLKQLKVEGVH